MMNFLSVLNQPHPLPAEDFSFLSKRLYLQNQQGRLDLWKPYRNEDTGETLLILGRPLIDRQKLEIKEEAASAISQHLLRKRREQGWEALLEELNGIYTIVHLDEKRQTLSLITDRAGCAPVYVVGSEENFDFQLTTSLFATRQFLDYGETDLTSVAEFLTKGCISFPHTYFRKTRQLHHGYVYQWDFHQQKTNHFRYSHLDFQPSSTYTQKECSEELAHTLQGAVKLRTQEIYGKSAVFLSGGADSRVIAANGSHQIEAITLYDQENYETRIAQQVSRQLGIQHHLIRRDKNYYFSAAKKSHRYTDALSNFTHDHFSNLRENALICGYDTLLTGCYADWLFKGITLNRTVLHFLGKKLPHYRLSAYQPHFFGANTKIKSPFYQRVAEREFLSQQDAPETIERARIFPLSNEETSATRLTLQRLFPWDSPFVDKNILEIYKKIPSHWKINPYFYEQSISLATQPIESIPHATYRYRLGALPLRKFLTRFGNAALGKMKLRSHEGEGSWWDFKKISKSNEFKVGFMDKIPDDHCEIFREILGFDWKAADSQNLNYHLSYNMISMSNFLEDRSAE